MGIIIKNPGKYKKIKKHKLDPFKLILHKKRPITEKSIKIRRVQIYITLQEKEKSQTTLLLKI